MAEKTEFLTILNLFKSDEISTLEIANALLKTRLEKINSLSFDQYFMRDLIGYLQKSDSDVPDTFHADIYNILTTIIVEDKATITNLANQYNRLSSDVAVLKSKHSQLEKDLNKLSFNYFIKHNLVHAYKSNGDLDSNVFVTLDSLFETYDKWTLRKCTKQEFKEIVDIWPAEADKDSKWVGFKINTDQDRKKEKDALVYTSFIRHWVCEALCSNNKIDPFCFITLEDFFDDYCKWHESHFKMESYSYPKDKEEFKELVEETWSQKATSDNKWFGLRRK